MTENNSSNTDPVIARYIAMCGVASRRGAVELVKSGRITVNGAVCTDPARRIGQGDTAALDGKTLTPESQKVYVLLHKPRGYVSSSRDVHAKKLAVDLIDLPERLFPAGRLDKDSEGLMIFSNDGDFINQLGHPRYNFTKTYSVRLAREFLPEEIAALTGPGISSRGEILRAVSITRSGKNLYNIVLGEGKNREIRRMAEYFHIDVKRLIRTALGPYQLGDIPCGKYKLTENKL